MEDLAWVDAQEPRAPGVQDWQDLSPDQKARVLAELPAELAWEISPTWSDAARHLVTNAVDCLQGFYRSLKQPYYVSSRLAVYYPAEPVFAPSVLVCRVAPVVRDKWVVTHEGTGVDWTLDVFTELSGERLEALRAKYERLEVKECFFYELKRGTLTGFRFDAQTHRNSRIEPTRGRAHSEVLGLDLAIEGAQLRFFIGTAALPDAHEQWERAEALLAESLIHKSAAERRCELAEGALAKETKRADEEMRRADAEASRAEDERERAEVEQQRAMTAEESAATERDRRLELERAAGEWEQRHTKLEADLREREEAIATLRDELLESERHRADLANQLTAQEHRSQMLQQQVAELDNRLAAANANSSAASVDAKSSSPPSGVPVSGVEVDPEADVPGTSRAERAAASVR